MTIACYYGDDIDKLDKQKYEMIKMCSKMMHYNAAKWARTLKSCRKLTRIESQEELLKSCIVFVHVVMSYRRKGTSGVS